LPTPDIHTHLANLYAAADDPWNTHASPYEQGKFAKTVQSLPRTQYRCALEVGCGAGALTAHLAPRCDHLIATDCTERALSVARSRVTHPHVTFTHGSVPADWPNAVPDLIVLSEVLYFLTDAESVGLAARICQDTAADTDIVMVNWSGDTGGLISGRQAADRLVADLGHSCECTFSQVCSGFSIEVLRKGSFPRIGQMFSGTT